MTYLIAFCLSFTAIFLKGLAQQNMIYKRKAMIMPTSLALACAEMMTAGVFVSTYIDSSLLYSLSVAGAIGVGGGIGALLSLDFHAWVSNKIYKWKDK